VDQYTSEEPTSSALTTSLVTAHALEVGIPYFPHSPPDEKTILSKHLTQIKKRVDIACGWR